MNSKIIAEGIETEAELKKVIDLGIDYGQGFFIAKPNNPIPSITNTAKQSISLIKTSSKSRSVMIDISDEIILVQNGIILKRQPASSLLNGKIIKSKNEAEKYIN
jgi:c-di-GMP-related signal transduction protein